MYFSVWMSALVTFQKVNFFVLCVFVSFYCVGGHWLTDLLVNYFYELQCLQFNPRVVHIHLVHAELR